MKASTARSTVQELIRSLVASELRPYADKIAQLYDEVDDLKRRQRNQNRVGICSAVDPDKALVKVKHGGNETPWVKWFALYAGDVKEYRCPSIGEQCLLLNYAAGDNSSQSFALFGLFSDQFQAPSQDPNEILRVYPDGSRVSYHTKNHKFLIDVKGDVEVNVTESAKVDVGKDATVTAGGIIKADATKIHLNGGAGVVTGAHICQATGLPHSDCSSTVTAGK